jgi:hypothetical protein
VKNRPGRNPGPAANFYGQICAFSWHAACTFLQEQEASMRTIIRAGVLAGIALLVGSADVGAQVFRRAAAPQNGVCFYDDVNYSGRSFCIDTNRANPLVGMNDRVSSFRVFGNAAVTVYEDRDFQGRSQTFASDINDLRRAGWNDTITSVVVRPAGGGVASRAARPAVPASGACFFEGPNFSGQYFCSSQGETVDMVPQAANDRISSIRLLGDAELVVYRDRDFGGLSHLFNQSDPDLRDSGWDDTISSYRIERRGTFANRGRANDYDYGYGQRGRAGDLGQTDGILEWRGRVDERVQLVIRGRSIEERTLSGTRFQAGRAALSSGLPAEPVRVGVRSLAGRGFVSVVQQPAGQNNYTAIIEIYDPERGAQDVWLQVNWR